MHATRTKAVVKHKPEPNQLTRAVSSSDGRYSEGEAEYDNVGTKIGYLKKGLIVVRETANGDP